MHSDYTFFPVQFLFYVVLLHFNLCIVFFNSVKVSQALASPCFAGGYPAGGLLPTAVVRAGWSGGCCPGISLPFPWVKCHFLWVTGVYLAETALGGRGKWHEYKRYIIWGQGNLKNISTVSSSLIGNNQVINFQIEKKHLLSEFWKWYFTVFLLPVPYLRVLLPF